MILSSEQQIREYTENGAWGTDTVYDLFRRRALATPDAEALVDPPNRCELMQGDPRRLTYAEMAAEVDRLAGGLLSLGLTKDDIVLVQLPNIAELVIVLLAAAKIGLIITPVPIQYRTHELRQVIALTEPKAMITTKSFAGAELVDMALGLRASAPGMATIIALGEDLPEDVLALRALLDAGSTRTNALRLEEHVATCGVTANDILTVCWTSGTEADPKGVPRSHNHWIWIAWASVDGCELKEGYSLLNPFPMVSMAAIGGMLVPWLLTGGKLVLHHPLCISIFLDQITREKIDYALAPPAMLSTLLLKPELLKGADLRSIKVIGSGSAPLSAWMVKGWQEEHGIHVVNIFGSNEGASFTNGPGESPDPVDRAQYFPRFGAGPFEWRSRIAAQMKTKLVEPSTKAKISVPGIPGEMAIRSPGIFPGYFRRPDLSAKCFDAEGYFYTGDLFEIASRGRSRDRYRFVGRLKDIIIRGGMNVSSEEIEAMIIGHPKVLEAAVIGFPDDRLGEKICAVVVPKSGHTVTLSEIVDFLKAKDIAVYKLPERLVVAESLPRSPVGKVLKRLLRQGS